MRIVRYAYPTYRNLAAASRSFRSSPCVGLEAEIDRLFETSLGDFTGAQPADGRFPVDLYEDKDQTYVRAELPGVNRADIDVEVVDDTLKISATRKTAATADQPEQSFALARSVCLNTPVQTDQIKATYENGVLTVALPKREEAKPKKISVAVN